MGDSKKLKAAKVAVHRCGWLGVRRLRLYRLLRAVGTLGMVFRISSTSPPHRQIFAHIRRRGAAQAGFVQRTKLKAPSALESADLYDTKLTRRDRATSLLSPAVRYGWQTRCG